MDNNKNIERFRSIMATVKRPGVENLMTFIENKSDFYTAPASTRFHLSCDGGLLQHSLNLCDQLLFLRDHIGIGRCENIVRQPAQCIFCTYVIFIRTEDDSDWRIVSLFIHFSCIIVQIHIQLTYRLRH